MMPCCSAIGLIFSKYASASLNSALVGVKTGHSGGALKSYSESVPILTVLSRTFYCKLFFGPFIKHEEI